MQVSLSKAGDYSVVTIEGRIDTVSAPEFEKSLEGWIREGQTRFLLDLSKLEYISSAGLRSVLIAGKTARANGGRVCCCGLTGLVKQVFDVSGFSALIPVFDSVDAALEEER